MRMTILRSIVLAAAWLGVFAAHAQIGTSPGVLRLGNTSAAQLTLPGQLVIDTANRSIPNGLDMGRNSQPYELSLAFNDQWGLVVLGETSTFAQDRTGLRASGFSNTGLVLKRAFALDGSSAFGLEVSSGSAGLKDSLNTPKAAWGVKSIYSTQLGRLHVDANVNLSRLALQPPELPAGPARFQTGMSAAFSVPISSRWNLTGEVAGAKRPGVENALQMTTGFSYTPTKRVTIDMGLARSLNTLSPEWSLFTGVVIPISALQ